MSLPKEQLEPIMTNSENIVNYFNNAYSKPATALNILRETIMGRELFDFAFKEYCRRWAFKHPTPADFFRTMEDASGIDLDWFWKGWFYTTDAVDISLDSIIWYKVDLEKDPESRDVVNNTKHTAPFQDISRRRNRKLQLDFAIERDSNLQDFYDKHPLHLSPDSVMLTSIELYGEKYSAKEKKQAFGDKNFYELHISNRGGLVMPVIIEWTFLDGTKEVQKYPWRSGASMRRNLQKSLLKINRLPLWSLTHFRRQQILIEAIIIGQRLNRCPVNSKFTKSTR